MVIDVPIPSMGATVNEMTLIDLLIEAGSQISKGSKIAEFESDKSVFDFEAPCDGIIKRIFARAGDVIETGRPFLRLETSDASLSHLEISGDEVEAESETKVSALSAMQELQRSEPVPVAASASAAGSVSIKWTPRAKKIATDAGVNPNTISDITATGPGGRVTGDDIESYLKSHGDQKQAPAAEGAPASGVGQTVSVAGIGYAVPKNIRSNEDILKDFPGKTEEEIVKVTGILQRYIVGEGESATSMAVEATNHALKMANLKVEDIDAVIVATLLPDQPVPGAASALAKELGIVKALAFDLNAACSGWLYALEVGRTFILGGTAKNILVVTAEILSSITNPKDHITAFLFGDGAGAAILTPAQGGHRLYRQDLSGDARFCDAISRKGGGAMNPIPQPGDNLDDFYLQMDGSVVFKRAVIAFGDIIESTLKRHGMTKEDVSWIVPHQPNARILKAVSKRVGIPWEKFVVTVNKYGNTSAASVSMALGWAAEEGIFEEGDNIVFCSVGAGFTFAGGLLQW